MTEAQKIHEYDGPHEGPIKTPRQLVIAIVFSFLVPIFGIVLLVMYVTTEKRPSAGTDALKSPAAIEARIRPVASVEIKDLNDLSSLKTGDQVYAAQCSACHAAGTLGSPRFGDAAAWAPRIKTGYAALLQSSLGGKGQMPPQGGGDFSDYEIGRAVVYMANQAGGKLAEPPAPVATAAASGAAASEATAAATSAPATPMAAAAAAVASAPSLNVPNPVPGATPPPLVAAAPTATAAVATTPAAATVAAAPPALYGQICSACHIAGVAGAPKLGDKAAWAPRIAQGIDVLTATVIKGKGAMPPKGGSTASEAEIKAVVTYMVSTAR